MKAVQLELEFKPYEEEVKTKVKVKKEKPSPLLKSYDDLKAKHPDAVLLFRCGDFYESYREDASILADVLGITATKRRSDNVMVAGFPHHALDGYLPRLIRAGRRVAICDMLEEPKRKKKAPAQ